MSRAPALARPARMDDPATLGLTPGQRWRYRRDLIIAVAHHSGASQRLLADVFDLPHSRIGAILKAHRERHANPRDGDD